VRAVVRGALVVSCALAFVGVAEAKLKSSPTEVGVFQAPSDSIGVQLSSDFKGCLRERTVSFADGAGDVFATATSDRGGALALDLDAIPAGISGLRVAVAESRFANRVCEADSFDVPVDFATLDGGVTGAGVFGGVLFSSIEACEPDRAISVYEISSDPTFVGFDLTDASGAWSIAPATGTYEARAERTFVQAPDGLTLCSAVVSFPWSYEEPSE
jgi:hypothetical protein